MEELGMKVEHNEKERKFSLKVAGSEGSVRYKKLSDRVWDFYFTFMPSISDGEGVKERIISYALNFARANNIRIKASCISIQNFLLKNRDFKEVLYFPY